jgi:hypothetical protein
MKRHHHDPLGSRVRQAAPILDDAVASAWSDSRAKSALFEEIRTVATGGRNADASPRRRRPWMPAMTVSAAAAAAVFGLVLGVPRVGVPGIGGPPPSASAPAPAPVTAPTAAQFLLAASTRAATQPGPPILREGQFWYAKSQGFSEVVDEKGHPHTRLPLVYESWTGPDGTGRIVRRDGDEPPLDEPLGEVLGEPPNAIFPIGERYGTYQDLLALPTDPAALRANLVEQLRGYDGRPLDVELFQNVNDVLRGPAPPALRAALLEVASGIEGVELVGDVTDRLGRHGVAIAMTDEHGHRQEITLDPDTATVLGEREIEPASDNKPEEVLYESTVVANGVVNSTEERP